MAEMALIPTTMDAVELYAPGGLDPVLAAIRQKVAEFTPDLSTPTTRKAIASMAFAVARSKTFLDSAGRELVAGEKSRLSKIDAERKRMRDDLDGLRDSVRAPLTQWETEQERANTAIAEIRTRAAGCNIAWDVPQLNALITNLGEIATGPICADRLADVTTAKDAALDTVNAVLVERQKIEAERVELERLRAEQEAAATAQREEAERLERERQRLATEEVARKAAAERAAREKAEAEQRERDRVGREALIAKDAAERATREAEAHAAAERDRVASEARARIEAEVRAKREADEREQKRQVNAKHRAKVTRDTVAALMAGGVDGAVAATVVRLASEGKAGSLTVQY